jgi:DNA polymerase III subunit beta
MILTCETKDLLAALAVAGNVVPAKAPWPVLLNIKLVTNDDRLTITGSDADTTFEMTIPARVETEGVCLLPYATLTQFVKAAKATEVRIEDAKGDVTVKAGRARIVLQSADVESFPNYLAAEVPGATVDAPAFASALRFAAAGAGTNEMQFHLCGVHFCRKDGMDRLAGASGPVLHIATISGGEIGEGILPNAAIPVVLRAMEKADTAHVAVSDRGWRVEVGPLRIWGKVIAGSFPDIDRAVASRGTLSPVASASRSEISEAIGVATCGADTLSTKASVLAVQTRVGGAIAMWGIRGAAGVTRAGRTEVSASGLRDYRGAFVSKYLAASISSIGAEDVVIAANEAGETMQITPAQESATVAMRAIIMGVRFSEAEMADV